MNYVHISGGKDSTALAVLLYERGVDFELVFSDTGAEFPETYWMVSRIAKVLGKKLHVISNGSFFEHLVARGWFLPSFTRRWCTVELKLLPLQELCDKPNCTVYIGFRADEQKRLSRGRIAWKNAIIRYPLIENGLNKDDVFKLCRKFDLLNPLYSWRSNVSCFCCPLQRKSDWLGLLHNYPQLYALAEQWEEISGYNWRPNCSLRQLRMKEKQQPELWLEELEPCAICTV